MKISDISIHALIFQVEFLVETECFDVRGKRLASVVRQIIKALMDDSLLAGMTWGGMSRETKNGKPHNFSLRCLKGVVRCILSMKISLNIHTLDVFSYS